MIMQRVESSDFLQERGRWANCRMWDFYIHEVSAKITSCESLCHHNKVLTIADSVLGVIDKAELLLSANPPSQAWHFLFHA